MQNLFELSLEDKERWLKDLADLMGVWEDWRLLATHGERLLPLASQVAQSTWQRLVASSFTQGVAPALEAIAGRRLPGETGPRRKRLPPGGLRPGPDHVRRQRLDR